MDYVVLLIVTGCVAVGVTAAVVRTWNLHARLYSLEDRINTLEGIQTREVKIRAAQERWSRQPKEDALFAQIATATAEPKKGPWWKNPRLKTGTYSG